MRRTAGKDTLGSLVCSRRHGSNRQSSAFKVLWLKCIKGKSFSCRRRIDEVRRETADAEQRAAQLEAELQRMIAAHTEREEDLDRKMDNLNRHAAWL